MQEEKAIERGILTLLQRATLVQTFGQRNHFCLKDGSITIPPYAPPQKMQSHLIPPSTPRSIFVYFRGLFYDVGNDPEGGYYARYTIRPAPTDVQMILQTKSNRVRLNILTLHIGKV